MAGRWHVDDTTVFASDIGDVTSEQVHPLGKIVRGSYTGYASGSDAYGAGEFIYLKGVASTIATNLVAYDPLNGTTTLVTAAAHGTDKPSYPVAVAMAATTAGTYGWYQIAGAGLVRCTGSWNPATPVYVAAASGALVPTTATGDAVLGITPLASSSTTSIKVLMNRPHMTDSRGT